MRKKFMKLILPLVAILVAVPIFGGSPEVKNAAPKHVFTMAGGKFKTLAASPPPSSTFVNSRGLLIDGSYTLYMVSSAGASPPIIINSVLGVALDANGYVVVNCTSCGGGGTPGGASGTVQFNNGGAFGGVAGSSADGDGNVTLGAGLEVDSINSDIIFDSSDGTGAIRLKSNDIITITNTGGQGIDIIDSSTTAANFGEFGGSAPLQLGNSGSGGISIDATGANIFAGGGTGPINLISAGGGFQMLGAAPSGHYPRGNGTNYVDGTIQAGDLPITVSGQANGVIPLATGANAIGAQSHCNDGVTTAATVTCSEPLSVTSLSVPGNGTTAGNVGLGQGTAPALNANQVQLVSPASVQAAGWQWLLPGTENGSAGILLASAAATHVTTFTIGTLPCSDMPALTGNVTSSAGGCATTVAAVPAASLPLGAGVSYGAGGGTANAQTVTTSVGPPYGTLTIGVPISWLPSNANSAAATLAINSLTAKSITKCGAVALVANDLTTTSIATAIYDGTEFILQNPQGVLCVNGITGTSGTLTIQPAASQNAIYAAGSGGNASLGSTRFSVSQSGGIIGTYDNIATAGLGVPFVVGTVSNVTNQTASQSTVTLGSSLATGSYLVRYYFDEKTACSTVAAGGVLMTISWTDGTLARTLTTSTLTADTTGIGADYVQGTASIFLGASATVSYTTTYGATCGTGGPFAYDLHASLERTQ